MPSKLVEAVDVFPTVLELLKQVQDREPVSPKRLTANLPVDLETICLKCLAKEPQRRYESAQALADDLDRFLRGIPVLARPVGNTERISPTNTSDSD